jgi:hypothetical protein
VAVDAKAIDLPAAGFQLEGRLDNAGMLDSGDDQSSLGSLYGIATQESQQGQIICFGATTGEDNSIGLPATDTSSQQLANPLAGVFQGPTGQSARFVLAAGISQIAERSLVNRLGHLGQYRCSGVVIEINHVAHAGIISFLGLKKQESAARLQLLAPDHKIGGNCHCQRISPAVILCTANFTPNRFQEGKPMAVLLRALLMLVVLIGLPAAWVYYGPLPTRAQGFVDRVVNAARTTIGWDQPAGDKAISAPYYLDPAVKFNDPAVTQAAAIEAVGVGSPATEVASSGVPTLAGSSLQEQLAPFLQQLRDQGAIEYALEKWGNEGQLYRFRCDLPLAESDQLTRQFEAIHHEPRESIAQVLAKVTTWRAARLNGSQYR